MWLLKGMLLLITKKNEEGESTKYIAKKKIVGILGGENGACRFSKPSQQFSFLVFVVKKWSLSLCSPLSISSRRVSKRGSLVLRQVRLVIQLERTWCISNWHPL